jgi:hypothetical protein
MLLVQPRVRCFCKKGFLGFVITLKGVWKGWVQVALQASIKPIQVERWIEHAEKVNVRDGVEH